MVMVKAYQKYKDAKLTWLEKVPEGWQILRGKTVFRCIDMRSKDGSEELLSVSSKDGVVLRSSKKITMFMAESYAGYKLCWPGDLVVNSLWAWMFGLGFSRHHGIVSSAYGVYRTRSQFLDHWQYFDYLIRSKAYAWELRVRSRGVWTSRLQMTDDRFLDMPILIPPKEEAIKIVNFLSILDIQIRRFIRAKQQVIKLLNEQKQAIINKAVTRGIDPNARLNPSAVDWEGDVPEEWEVLPIKRLVKTKMSDGPHETPEFVEEGIAFVSAEASINGRIDFNHKRGFIRKEAHVEYCKKIKPQRDDIFIVKSGSTTGKVCIIDFDDEFSVWSPLALVRTNYRIIPAFAFFALTSDYFQKQVQDKWSFGTQPNIGMEVLQNLKVVFPKEINEQKNVVTYIQDKIAPIKLAVSEAEHEMDLIREYRARLISDAVTGKMDVRDAKLPEMKDIAGSEPIEERENLEDVEDTEEVVNADE